MHLCVCVCVCVCVYRFFFVGFYFHNIVFGKMLYILIILILLHLWRLVFWLNSGSVLEDFIWALECDCVAFEWNLKRFIKSSSVQFSCSIASNSLWPHESQHTRPSCPHNSQSLPKPISIELMMPSNHLILWHALLLLPSNFPSIRVF